MKKKIYYPTIFCIAKLTLGLTIHLNAIGNQNQDQGSTTKREKTFGGGLKKSWDLNKALVAEAIARANENSNNLPEDNAGDTSEQN